MGCGTQRTETLPDLYQSWIDAALSGPIPAETVATCDDCAMCGERAAAAGDANFDPRVKCCGYVPELPNFLVGRVLLDGDPAAQAGVVSVRDRIEERFAVTPLGLGRSKTQALLYDHLTKRDGFGRNTMVRCPHYASSGGGSCSIWRHRNSVCATFFCKHVRGATGKRFWEALRRLLGLVEQRLAHWCLLRLDLDTESIARILQADEDGTDGTLDEAHAGDPALDRSYRRLWGTWHGREAELYRTCARLVESLSWEEVVDICGAEAALAARVARRAYERLTDASIPDRLRVGRHRVVRSTADASRVCTYSSSDPLDVPHALLRVLPAFDGRPTDRAVGEIADEHGVSLSPELLRKLVDFEMLEPEEEEPATT